MANQEHVNIFQKSIAEWNMWRQEHPEIQPDLREAILSFNHAIRTYVTSADLSGANFSGAILYFANISLATYVGANFHKALISGADLSRSNFKEADFSEANLSGADFGGAELNGANFSGADLSHTRFNGADLSSANLSSANLSHSNLRDANFYQTFINDTQFGDHNFRLIKNLETVNHLGPSPLSINSLYLSEGTISEVFVRGTGAPDTFIEYMRALTAKPIEYYTCFISYSSRNQDFAERLLRDLKQE